MIKTFLAALSLWNAPAAPCDGDCKVTPAGIALIKHFEGYSPYPYRDAAGHWTIGYGHLMQKGGAYDEPLVGEAAQKLLEQDVASHARQADRLVRVPLWPLQFDAVASWTFNLGPGALQNSTMLKRINAGAHAEVPVQMKRWNKAGGRVLPGLVRRREAEAGFYQKARP